MASAMLLAGLVVASWAVGCASDASGGAAASGGVALGPAEANAAGASGGGAAGVAAMGGGLAGNAGGSAGQSGNPAGGTTGGADAAGTGGAEVTAGTGGASASGTGGGAAGVAGGAGDGGAAGNAGADPVFHVFLLLGQSNMAGYPKAQAADEVENPRIEVLGYDDCAATGRQKDAWAVAVPPLHECWNGAIGPGDYFSKTLLEKLPADDTIGLVPCAISGEKIETFLKAGGSKYGWIVERARMAQARGGVIEGILFHQGESNNSDPSWPGKVNTLVTDLRADLGLGDVPFLAGELAYDGGGASHNGLVNMLPSVVTNAYVVSASGLALDPADTQWRLHFGHDAQVTLGERYAAKMIEALGL